jgi:Family of unknown function (DUF6049)
MRTAPAERGARVRAALGARLRRSGAGRARAPRATAGRIGASSAGASRTGALRAGDTARRAAVVAAIATLVALVALPAGQARAQQTGSDQPAVQLILDAVAPVNGPKAPLAYRVSVRNRGHSELRNLHFQGRIGSPIRTRSELQQMVGEPGDPTDPEPGGLAAIQSWQPPNGTVVAPGATTSLPAHTEPFPTWLSIPSPGTVLPMAIELRASNDLGSVSTHLVTFVVVTNGKIGNPLQISLLVPLHEQTHRNAAGDFVDDKLAKLLAPSGSLGGIAATLAQPNAPKVTMVIDPLLTDEATAMGGSWQLRHGRARETIPADDARSVAAKTFVQNLRVAAGRNLPSAMPYASADLPSLVQAGSDAEALAPLLYAQKHLREWLGPDPDSSLAWPVPGAIDAATLKMLGEAGAESAVLDSHLLPTNAGTTQNATVDLGAGLGGLEHAIVPDSALAATLTDPRQRTEPAEWAQRVVAETAVTWLELPNGSTPRGILLAPPQDWRPSPGFFSALVHGLGGSPWLNLVPAQQLARQVPQGPDRDPRQLAPYTADDVSLGLPASYLHTVSLVNSRLTSFSRMVGSDFRPLDDYDRDLLIAQSSDWRTAAGRARGMSFVRAVSQGMKAVQQQVGVQRTRVTLTSRRGAIPITVTNAGTQRLTVVLKLSSPRVDLPPTSEQFTVNGKEQVTRRVEVGTRTTGTFPIRVDVFTPDGKVNIARGQVTLVSTAFNRVALILAGSAGGFLLLWWGKKTGWRRRGSGKTVEPPEGAS